MTRTKAVAIVGLGAVMPDANSASAFWENIKAKRYLIKDVPADRWSAEMYYHNDPSVPDKTYSKIGSWVSGYPFEPLKWGILIPPSVLGNMDDSQKWSISASREALLDYGYPERPLNPERVAVIFGNSLAGEKHYRTNLRIHIPQFTQALGELEAFQLLSPEVQQALQNGMEETIRSRTPEINEDTMPGELANIIAGRVANVFNFSGANFVTDAACASSLAAIQASMDGLLSNQYDAVLTGGVDRNNGAASFVKFAKIGALSPDGSRPYAEGANGFVMGEGAAVFLLKRLEDAERDQDKIYAVIRGVGSSSDGKGKGITAPNPTGQQRAIERAWKDAGVDPISVGLIEGHGTSTKVGDVVEVNSLASVFGNLGLPPRSVGLGSVKSNIGHLKSASGAAGLLKLVYALHEKTLPPSANFQKPNPDIPFAQMPFYVVTETQPWEKPPANIRRAGLSSFGFGGTNFHMVIEEYLPGLLTSEGKLHAVPAMQEAELVAEPVLAAAQAVEPSLEAVPELFGAMLFLSADSNADLIAQLRHTAEQVSAGQLPPSEVPGAAQLRKHVRLAISYEDAAQLGERIERAFTALDGLPETNWQAYGAHGIYYGEGAPGKVAFLFPGQGSQYVNMMRDIAEVEPLVAETFRQADDVMTPHLGQPLTSYIFQDSEDEEVLKAAARKLSDTTITQPAILTANIAMLRLMQKFNIEPDMLIGHSLGEYAALVASESITFKEGLEVVSARGRAMASLEVEDNGTMAAVSAPIDKVEEILASIDGYVILANINSPVQCVIGGATDAVDKAVTAFEEAGIRAVKIPVSHAFHTKIVAPASDILRAMLEKIDLKPPKLPIAANVTGQLYPNTRAEMLELLSAHIASSVQFVKGVQTLYDNGCRVYIEAGPKRVLSSLSRDILKDYPDVTAVATNHGRKGGVASFHEALCSLYAAGLGVRKEASQHASADLGAFNGQTHPSGIPSSGPARQTADNPYPPLTGSVVISGAGLGLPGRDREVFNDDNIRQILEGEIRIEALPEAVRQEMVDRKITRLEKGKNGAEMVSIDSLDQTLKLAGQRGTFDLAKDFGVKSERVSALDISTQLAIAAGIEALRDAGIPLVMRYKPTSTGGFLPQRWMLPPSLVDETGVIFASAFPGLDQLSHEAAEYHHHKTLSDQIALLQDMLIEIGEADPAQTAVMRTRLEVLEAERQALDYGFDRKFIFRILNMGHAQFAEYIGARGPNTGVNAACATTTHAVAIAEDWIRAGRARRVVVIAGDDVTSGDLVSWVGTGLLASGATTTEGNLRLAALPFDQRRNGMIPGMGAAALVVESQDAVAERGMGAIAEVLATDIANSAFHGTRLDVGHVSEVMQRLMHKAERQYGIDRHAIAGQTMFMSHETYTPARGGSAAAEIRALRDTFGSSADQVMVTNTKGYTGHTMGVGIEDVVAVKGLEHSKVPPIANLDESFQPDPELGNLNLSRTTEVKDVHYALRLGAGFGSQIAMALLRRIPGVEQRVNQPAYHKWLAEAAGYETAELEVVQRTLRIKDQGVPARQPKPSTWVYGTGPRQWAPAPDKTQPAAKPVVEQSAQPELTPAAAPVSAPDAVPAPVASADDEAIKAFVLNLVSEKTGYPTDILDLGLDLEADLGIDTVKQAELFASVRENYGIPRREDLMLADYNNLEKVIGFVKENLGQELVAASPAPAAEPAAPSAQPEPALTAVPAPVASADDEAIKTFVLNLVSEKTGYPTDILDLGLDLEADLGIDTVKQAELFAAVRENYGIPRRDDLMLADYNTLEKVIGFVKDNMGGDQVEDPAPEPAPEPVGVAVVQPEPAASPAPEADDEAIKVFVLNLVSEKTGYPTDILDLGLDLEADLGIDTVKQAELFASVRENYGIPRREDLMLADYNTLEKVIGFVKDNMDQAAEETVETPADPAAAETDRGQAIPRRVPAPMLRPRLDLCLPTGVILEKGSRVIVVTGHSSVGTALVKALEEREVEVLRLKASDDIVAQAETWLEQGQIKGVFYLPGLDNEPDLEAMTADEWDEMLQTRLEPLYALMKTVPEDIFLVSATRAGGLHGYDENGALMTGAGVSGFTKALAIERRSALVKVIDFAARDTSAEISEILIAETLRDPAAAEIGYREGQRYSIALIEAGFSPETMLELPEQPVFLVSGGTGGITLPILTDLARHTRGRFYLIGRAPLPAADDPDLALLRTSKADLQSKWMQESEAAGEKLTPVQIRGKVEALERIAATLETIETIRELGGEAAYLTGDVTERKSIDKLVMQVVRQAGRIDVLIHAAGYERSRKLRNKPLDEFRGIVAVKTTGFIHLYKSMQAAKALPKAMVLFSSIAGRYGNTGQTDYSAANDLLAKIASALPHRHPGLRAVALDWGAWGEVGMASRGNIPWLMEQAGIEMIDPTAGAPLVYNELVHGSGHEALFSGSLGALEESGADALDLEAANQALREGDPPHIMLSSVSGYSLQDGVTFEVTLDPNSEPFLHDHALNGTPLLPGVMGIEGFAVAAQHISSVLGSSEKSELRVSALEDIEFLTPFKFYRNEPRHILWKAMPLRQDGHLTVSITLESRSPSKLAADSDELIQHFSGTVHLQPESKAAPAAVIEAPEWNGHYTLKDKTIYELYFHGPAFQVLEGVQRSGDHLLGKLRKDLPEFTSKPTRLDTTPLLLELCLQTAGIWEIGLTGAMALPLSIGKVTLYHRPVNGEPIYAQVHMDDSEDGIVFSSQVVDGAGNLYLEMENYRTSATPYPVDEVRRAPLKQLIAGD